MRTFLTLTVVPLASLTLGIAAAQAQPMFPAHCDADAPATRLADFTAPCIDGLEKSIVKASAGPAMPSGGSAAYPASLLARYDRTDRSRFD